MFDNIYWIWSNLVLAVGCNAVSLAAALIPPIPADPPFLTTLRCQCAVMIIQILIITDSDSDSDSDSPQHSNDHPYSDSDTSVMIIQIPIITNSDSDSDSSQHSNDHPDSDHGRSSRKPDKHNFWYFLLSHVSSFQQELANFTGFSILIFCSAFQIYDKPLQRWLMIQN